MAGEARSKKAAKALGPVDQLEKHLHPDWWNRIFNSLYLKTDGDVVEDARITDMEVDRFSEHLGLKAGEQLLDICCGQGRHVLEWAHRGFEVCGMDRSRYLIQKAKSRAKAKNLNVSLKEGDARKLPFTTDRFDAVTLLGNSFGYFESASEDLLVLQEVKRVLKPGGRLLLDVSDGEFLRQSFEPRSWEWIDKNLFVCRERSIAGDGQRLISREVITDVKKGVIADQFYAERLYSQAELGELLAEAGFSEIEWHGEMVPESQRNQDLGMMSRRLVVTAKMVKEWTPVRRRSAATARKVTVLLGDPRKLDIIKPDAVFDEDDFVTLKRLKDALANLGDFRFKYIDDHDTMIAELKKLSGKDELIFNLCDEGFGNDPRQELHVPALLELFNLPYTGSNPQCLAFCYDKSLVRGAAREMGVAVSQAFFVRPDDSIFELPIEFPVLIKPNFGDSSFGITQKSLVHNMEELAAGIARIRDIQGFEKPFLVEEFLPGKDISFGVIGNAGDFRILPIIEEDYSGLPEGLPRICGYEAKWLPDSPYSCIRSIPANLPLDVEKEVIDGSLALFERLECRDYARFDWRLDKQGRPRLLEVNPNPGWCWDGHLAKMSHLENIDYSAMLGLIVEAAFKRTDSVSAKNSAQVIESQG
ncbi:MAG: methyltransferase domain-containing protein [bacterium]|nr:methyltransferase domain-containing protein [bacterium]